MIKAQHNILIIILNLISICSAFGQNHAKSKSFNQKNFEKNKIFENAFHLWESKFNGDANVNDTAKYFVDDRNYKGIVNYGVQFKSKDFRAFTFFENISMFFLSVDIESCMFNSMDNTIIVEGFVSGGWSHLRKNDTDFPKNFINIYIGEKTDTTISRYYRYVVNKEKVETLWKNRIIGPNQVLDTFPSFYFKKPSCFVTEPNGRRPFKISSKITSNTIMAFGAGGCYSEIFDIGTMVFQPNKNKRKKIIKKEFKESEIIMINNKLVSDIEKEKREAKEINYYTYTEKAENHILRRQYADANRAYLQLSEKYKVLFSRDLHNAIRAAVLSRDYQSAFLWGEKLANKGISIKYFNSRIFASLKRNIEWKNFSSRYDSISNNAIKGLDFTFKKKLEDLKDEDQSDYGLENRKEPRILFETTERVTEKLVELLKKEGFPSEEKVGVYIINDTILDSCPAYNVLVRHAVQQYPSKLEVLIKLLDDASDSLVYDKIRTSNHQNFTNACFHIYKGNLYNSKACGKANEQMLKKIQFMFANPNNFIVDQGDYIIREYNKESPEEYDKYYEENYNLIMKLTDDWEFYEK